MERKINLLFCCSKCVNWTFSVGPETGTEFSVDDVVGGSSDLFTMFHLAAEWTSLCQNTISLYFLGQMALMSHSDNDMSSSTSIPSDEESYSSDSSPEMEIVGHVQSYADEPAAHLSALKCRRRRQWRRQDQDHDGLSPEALRARYEGEIVLDERWVFVFYTFPKNLDLNWWVSVLRTGLVWDYISSAFVLIL